MYHTLNTIYAYTHTFLHTADAVECNDTDAVKRVKLAEKAFGTNPPTLEKFTFKVREAEKCDPSLIYVLPKADRW